MLAVDGIDLDVRAGDVYGFLGANGSGKTTTVRMLLGLVLATSGRGRGARPADAAVGAATVLPQVGTLVEGPASYGHLSGRANLRSSTRWVRAPGAAGDRRVDDGARAGRARRSRATGG